MRSLPGKSSAVILQISDTLPETNINVLYNIHIYANKSGIHNTICQICMMYYKYVALIIKNEALIFNQFEKLQDHDQYIHLNDCVFVVNHNTISES